MQEESFGRVIAAHRELQRRNSALETRMPLDRYRQQFPAGSDDAPPEPAKPVPTAVPGPWDDPDSWWSAREQEPVGFDWHR
jgi:hypothetical protein